jgi:CTP:molybdopterin cytidylyltransferase MocA
MGGSIKQSDISAIVLAAGMSQRMGTAKQLLRLDGTTILEHTLANVRASDLSIAGASSENSERRSTCRLKKSNPP